jgi:predicted nucleic acid-binding protein
MAREIVFDANVIVAWLDGADALAARARSLADRLRLEGAEIVILDVLVTEAVSVLCRRARERKTPPNLHSALTMVGRWAADGVVRWVGGETGRLFAPILEVMRDTNGRLNFNDALLVVLQREGLIDEVATFDRGFEVVADFRRCE